MTPEELLKPRYKVIALWPFCRQHNTMSDQPKIGDVFLAGADESISNQAMTILHVDKYPHLFQKLEWYEERSHEELPDYVKRVYNGKLFVYKKEYWENSEESKGIKYTTSDGISLLNYIGTCEIATLEEYNAYQSSIKDTTTLTNKIK